MVEVSEGGSDRGDTTGGPEGEHRHDLPPTQRTNRRKVLERRDKRRPEHRPDMFTCRAPRVGAAAPRSPVTGRRRCGVQGACVRVLGTFVATPVAVAGRLPRLFFFFHRKFVGLGTLKLTFHVLLWVY